jgi:hypothetical protein
MVLPTTRGVTVKIPLMDMNGQIIEILDSKNLTNEEIELVRKNKSGALSLRELPNNERAS